MDRITHGHRVPIECGNFNDTRATRERGEHVITGLDERGTVDEQPARSGAAGARREQATLQAGRSRGRHRARADIGFDDDDRIRERGDQWIALEERTAPRLHAEREHADERAAVLDDLIEQTRVARWIRDVDTGAEHDRRRATGREGTAVSRTVDAERAARHHAHAGRRQMPSDRMSAVKTGARCGTGPDDRDRGTLGKRASDVQDCILPERLEAARITCLTRQENVDRCAHKGNAISHQAHRRQVRAIRRKRFR
jgi:hypothetical protein